MILESVVLIFVQVPYVNTAPQLQGVFTCFFFRLFRCTSQYRIADCQSCGYTSRGVKRRSDFMGQNGVVAALTVAVDVHTIKHGPHIRDMITANTYNTLVQMQNIKRGKVR